MQHRHLRPHFVKGVPRNLLPGVLYVSMEYGTVVHSCCCGCGQEIVTPLTPTDWRLTYDGEGISLWPSIGNWNLPCRSHYVIDQNRVIEVGNWGQARIDAERQRDRESKAAYYGQSPDATNDAPPAAPEHRGLFFGEIRETAWRKFKQWVAQK